MADKKISELNPVTNSALQVTDQVVVARTGSETLNMTVSELDKRYNQATETYFGDPTTDGTWRMRVSGGNFLIEVRVAGTYELKQEIEP